MHPLAHFALVVAGTALGVAAGMWIFNQLPPKTP